MPSSLIFTSNFAATGFAFALVSFFVSEQIGGVIIPAIRRGGAKVKRGNVGSNAIVLVSWVAIFSVPIVFAKMGIALLPDWVYFVGILLMFGGIAFRQYAIAVLGRYFSGVIGVQKEQKVVESGPYRLIRHPSYTGVLIFLVGMGVALQSWAAALLNVVIFALAYGYRIFIEEKVLIRELGTSYVEYMRRTKRVIPYIA
jgi:protein-S-isoprenylcysteine O-methyltransferase Ste14